jgi:hypothetical protein
MGSEHLEDPATTTAAGDPLPADCDGEIDWTLFTFTHGFRQPRTAVGTAPVRRVARAAGVHEDHWHGNSTRVGITACHERPTIGQVAGTLEIVSGLSGSL